MREWLDWQYERRAPDCNLVFQYNTKGQYRVARQRMGGGLRCHRPRGLHPYDMRRSAIRNMERAGISRHVAMAISGHKTEAVYRGYDIVVDQDPRTATEKLEQYQRAQQPKLKRVK